MTDIKLRSELLTRLYALRSKDYVIVGQDSATNPDAREELRIAQQLQDHGLIKLAILNRHLGASARITASGVDVMEGNIQPPIAIHMDKRQTINISGSSSFQVGDHNSQSITVGIEALVQQIDASSATFEEKVEAQSLVRKLLEHPLVSAIVGGAIGLAK